MKNLSAATTILAALVLIAGACPSFAEETIGVVRVSTGAATITRGDAVLQAAPGMKLIAGDILGTGPDGSLGVLLRDDSSLSIGPGSRMVVRSFLFSPAEGKYGLVARITRGTMAYLSGIIGKLAPEKARFETPTSTIGIRGTRFAVKVMDPSVP